MVLLGGAFTNVNGVARPGIARLHPDGSLDTAFDPGAGAQGSSHGVQSSVRFIVVQTNGEILIGGFFSEYGGLPRSGIARLNVDGSVDPSFNPSYGQDAVSPMSVQVDGKILAAGYFKLSGLIVEFARLHADGSVDDSFLLGRNELVSAHIGGGMALQMDGRILMNGHFVFSGANEGFLGVLRFASDGSIDRSYDSTNVIAGHPNSFILQADEKLIVGGRGAWVAGMDRDGVVRLNPDGSLDATFNARLGSEGDVFAVAVQPAGTILIGGSFRNVNGLSRCRIAQLDPNGSVVGSVELNPPTPMPEGQFRVTTQNWPPVSVIIEASSNLADWTPVYTNTARTSPLDFIDTNAAGFHPRFYRAVMKP